MWLRSLAVSLLRFPASTCCWMDRRKPTIGSAGVGVAVGVGGAAVPLVGATADGKALGDKVAFGDGAVLGAGTALGTGWAAAGALDTPGTAGRSAAASGPDRNIRSARNTIANTATAATTAATARTRLLVDGGFRVTNGVLARAAPGDATTTVFVSPASCSAGSTCPTGAG